MAAESSRQRAGPDPLVGCLSASAAAAGPSGHTRIASTPCSSRWLSRFRTTPSVRPRGPAGPWRRRGRTLRRVAAGRHDQDRAVDQGGQDCRVGHGLERRAVDHDDVHLLLERLEEPCHAPRREQLHRIGRQWARGDDAQVRLVRCPGRPAPRWRRQVGARRSGPARWRGRTSGAPPDRAGRRPGGSCCSRSGRSPRPGWRPWWSCPPSARRW